MTTEEARKILQRIGLTEETNVLSIIVKLRDTWLNHAEYTEFAEAYDVLRNAHEEKLQDKINQLKKEKQESEQNVTNAISIWKSYKRANTDQAALIVTLSNENQWFRERIAFLKKQRDERDSPLSELIKEITNNLDEHRKALKEERKKTISVERDLEDMRNDRDRLYRLIKEVYLGSTMVQAEYLDRVITRYGYTTPSSWPQEPKQHTPVAIVISPECEQYRVKEPLPIIENPEPIRNCRTCGLVNTCASKCYDYQRLHFYVCEKWETKRDCHDCQHRWTDKCRESRKAAGLLWRTNPEPCSIWLKKG
jgi:hypothetical protein